jgi:CBS domain-containing protein
MILVRNAMTSDLKTAKPDMTAADAAGLMRSYDIGAVLVVDDDTLAGLVTDRDLVMRVIADREDASSVRLGDIATRVVVTATPDMNVSDARDLMAEHRVRRLPVMQGDSLVGIISLGDIALADASKRAVGGALEDISESPSTTDVDRSGPDRGTPDRVHENRDRSG